MYLLHQSVLDPLDSFEPFGRLGKLYVHALADGTCANANGLTKPEAVSELVPTPNAEPLACLHIPMQHL